MGLADDIKNKAEEIGGKIKEGIGDLTGNEQAQVEGKADQGKAKAKQVGQDIKDTVEDIKDDLTK